MSTAGPTARVSFDESFYDVPNQYPAVPLSLQTVSVRNQHILMHVNDKLMGGSLPLLCEADVRVSLSANQRGIHMSRIQSAFQISTEGTLSDCAVAVAERVRESQQQEQAEVRLRARVPLETRTHVTGLSSLDTTEISAVARVGRVVDVSQEVAATNMTACPCMQGYALTDLINEIGLAPENGLDLLKRVPIATHSQRGKVSLAVRVQDPTKLPGYYALYQVLAAQTTLTQELLKRPDEYDLVRRTHFAPQFVEDVVRSVARGVIKSFLTGESDLCDTVIDIRAESYESIHGHDVSARLCAPASDLARTHI